MNKRQIKKYLQSQHWWWEPVTDTISYMKIDAVANRKHVQRYLRNLYGPLPAFWYCCPSPIKGIFIQAAHGQTPETDPDS